MKLKEFERVTVVAVPIVCAGNVLRSMNFIRN